MITEVRGFITIFDGKNVTENSKAFDYIVSRLKDFGDIGEHDAIRVERFGNTKNLLVRGKDINEILYDVFAEFIAIVVNVGVISSEREIAGHSRTMDGGVFEFDFMVGSKWRDRDPGDGCGRPIVTLSDRPPCGIKGIGEVLSIWPFDIDNLEESVK